MAARPPGARGLTPRCPASEVAPFEKILVAFQSTEAGYDGLTLGGVLATALDARLIVANVRSEHEQDALLWQERLRGNPGAPAAEVTYHSLSGRSPAAALQEFAEAESIDLIVLGVTHHGGIGGLAPGSVAEKLVNGAPCCVAVAPGRYRRGLEAAQSSAGVAGHGQVGEEVPLVREEPRVVAVAFDGAFESRLALQVAVEFSRSVGATLRVITVIPDAPSQAVTAADRDRLLHEVVATLPGELRALPIREQGNPVTRLLATAEEGVDLLVIGSRGRGPWRRVMLGSVSAEVAREAPCPVLIVPRPHGAAASALTQDAVPGA
jgi:nucleotide-binding universal stress UspA family protein